MLRDKQKTAEAVDHSMKKLDFKDVRSLLNGIATDAGRGGVYEGLARELKNFNRIDLLSFSLFSCSLHALNLMFCNAITKYVGTGGVKNVNALQLLFTGYALEQEFELETWNKLWNNINANTYGNCQKQPVLT